jgi:Mg-chelatase subunit ChlD
VAAFRLDYPRGTTDKFARPPWNSLAWRPWSDHVYERYDSAPYSLAPMPLLSDIAFDGSANMILGLRDRHMDASRIFHRGFGRGPGNVTVGVGFGDILRGTPNGLSWDVDTTTEHFRDNVAGLGDESALGGLAVRPDGRIIVAGSYAGKLWRGEYVTADGEGGYWYDSATGNPVQHEIVCDPAAAEPLDGLLFRAASVLADDEPATEYRARAVGSVGDVEVLCGPDVLPTTPRPSPSSTPPPTATTTCTPDARPSPTSTATACPTASPTVTAAPRPIHLPLGLREQCVPPKQHTDVALVIDASTSMRDDRTSAGRTKLDAAIEAARTFLATMSLPQDQAAVVAFNDDAKVLQELTGRRADVEAALTQIPRLVRQQTRIDRGIEDGHEELASARHKAVNRAVMIVLTDGLANPEPASTAVRRAQAAKEDKITIFAIGLGRGTELNVVELEQMASRPEYFYLAPDGEDLLAIYRTIALEIPCPADSFWGRR